MTAHVRVQALPGREFTGSVTRIAWALDPAMRTLLAEIDLPNRNGPLRPGMYAYATLTGEQTDRSNAATFRNHHRRRRDGRISKLLLIR